MFHYKAVKMNFIDRRKNDNAANRVIFLFSEKVKNEKGNSHKTMIDTGASGDHNKINNCNASKKKKSKRNSTRNSGSQFEKISKKSNEARTLFIIGDSHVRQLKDLVEETMRDETKVMDHFQGGASLLEICNYLKQPISDSDHIFVFGGTNDVDRTQASKLKPALLKLLKRYPRAKFTFILVPLRVHWNREYYQNDSIRQFNVELVSILRKMEHERLNFLDTNLVLHVGHYSRDGIHLNLEGKIAISTAIGHMFNENNCCTS